MNKVPTLKEIKKKYRSPRDNFVNLKGWEKYISANLAVLFSKFFLYLPITPNQVTLLWMLTAYIGCVSFAFSFHWYWYGIIGFGLMQLAFVLDCVDGIVARHKQIFSDKGDYIDTIGHRIQFPLMIACITIGAYFKTQNVYLFMFGFALLILFNLKGSFQLDKINLFLVYKKSITSRFLQNKKGKDTKTSADTFKWRLIRKTYSICMSIISPMALVNMAGLAAILNLFEWYIIIYAILYAIIVPPLLVYEACRGYYWVQKYVENGPDESAPK